MKNTGNGERAFISFERIMRYKEVKISEIFEFPSIKWLTANFISKNSGNIPVFWWRQNEEPIGYIADKLNGVKYFENCLWWNREWSVWYVFFHKCKFSTNDHHRPLLLKKSYTNSVDLNYIKNVLQLLLFEQWFAWSKTASKEKVQELFIKIPIDEKWEFDLEKQKEIANKYEKLDKIKDRIRIMKEDIEKQGVKLAESFEGKDMSIDLIFNLQRGDSKYTRKYGSENVWIYPVYSAWRERLTSINTFVFDGTYLTWATNGFAGYLKKINWKFSINSDRWIFIPKISDIDIDFVRYSIQSDLRNLTKWRVGDKWKNEFTKLSPDKIKENITIKVPTLKNWDFNLEKQKEIAKKYEKIEKIKNDLVQELEYLESVKVEI